MNGKDLQEFVKDQQDIERRKVDEERQERQRERDSKKLELEERERRHQREIEDKERERGAQARGKEAIRRHELELKQIEVQQASNETGGVSTEVNTVNSGARTASAKLLKLPELQDSKDDLDSYLQRFECFAKSNKWDEATWPTSLGALLTGKP